MNIDKKIKKLGIEEVSEVDELTKRKLARAVSTTLVENFQNSKLDKEYIEKKLIDTKMYIANIPKGMSKANYMYMNSSIYFDKSLNIEEVDEFILHECIHRVQEYKDKRKRLVQLGTCNFTTTKIIGLGFNEASIEYIISKVLENKKNSIQVYGINVPSISSKYYSLVTNLIEQIVYLIGTDLLVNSTINCNDELIYKCIDNFGEKNFYKIRENFDKILSTQDGISRLLVESKDKEKIKTEINTLQNTYFETQELIITSYFEILLKMINSLDEIEKCKQKLLNYKELMGKNGNYDFFDKYYEEECARILEKEEKIKAATALMVISNNPIFKAFRAIKKLFIKPNMEYNK